MKALLYKEFKLAMHPMCYIFIAAFPLMILIPNYPLFVGFIYILSCYPVLFLGANKGQQSNDLLFSTLLPVRKKDIVMARIITVAIMQFTYMAILSCLLPVALLIQQSIIAQGEESITVGIPLQGFGSLLAIAVVGYAIADLIFFPIYYKHGKSIVMSTLFTILGFVIYLSVFTLGIVFVPVVGPAYLDFLTSKIWVQFALLGGALILYFIIHYFVYKISAKRLEKVDF